MKSIKISSRFNHAREESDYKQSNVIECLTAQKGLRTSTIPEPHIF